MSIREMSNQTKQYKKQVSNCTSTFSGKSQKESKQVLPLFCKNHD